MIWIVLVIYVCVNQISLNDFTLITILWAKNTEQAQQFSLSLIHEVLPLAAGARGPHI